MSRSKSIPILKLLISIAKLPYRKHVPIYTPRSSLQLCIDVCSSHLSGCVGCVPSWGCIGGTSGKEPACWFRRLKRHGLNPWVGKISWRRAWQPTPVFLPGESHGPRSLADYSPWGHRVRHDWATNVKTSLDPLSTNLLWSRRYFPCCFFPYLESHCYNYSVIHVIYFFRMFSHH